MLPARLSIDGHHAIDKSAKSIRVEWLLDQAVRDAIEEGSHVGPRHVAGDEDDALGALCVRLEQLIVEVDPRNAWHPDVAEDDVVTFPPREPREGILRAVNRRHHVV